MKIFKYENVQEGQGFPSGVFLSFGRKIFTHIEITPVDFDNSLGMTRAKRTLHYNGWYIKMELPFKKNKKFINWDKEPALIGDSPEIVVIPCRKVIMYSSRLAYLNRRMRGLITVWNPLVPDNQKVNLVEQPD